MEWVDSRPGAIFSVSLRLADTDAARVTFFGSDRSAVLLEIFISVTEGRIWLCTAPRERRRYCEDHRVQIDPKNGTLSLCFSESGTSVSLDGSHLDELSVDHLRPGSITSVGFDRGVFAAHASRPSTLQEEGVRLIPPLSLVSDFTETVNIEFGTEILSLDLVAGRPRRLPARVWKDVSRGIKIVGGGGHTLYVDRSALCLAIKDAIHEIDVHGEAGAGLIALEAAMSASLTPLELGTATWHTLVELARVYRVPGILPERHSKPMRCPPHVSGSEKLRKWIGASRAERGHLPDADALLAQITMAGLSRDEAKDLVLALSEPYAAEGRTEVLFQTAASLRLCILAGQDIYTCAAALPFLVERGDLGEAAAALDSIATRAQGIWYPSPPVGWAIERVLTLNSLSPLSAPMIMAFLELLRREKSDPYGRFSCAWLQSGLEALVARRSELGLGVRNRLDDILDCPLGAAVNSDVRGLAHPRHSAVSKRASQTEEAERRSKAISFSFGKATALPRRSAAARQMDMAICIISCRANLSGRVAALQDTWLQEARRLGVPYVIAIGGGTEPAHLEGDLLVLPVSDAYEDLPRKVCAALDWVGQNTDAGHVLKIDDDCLLSFDALLADCSHKAAPYVGRVLRRSVGQTDRVWHQGRDSGAAVRIDSSPEPSVYADGGSGYVLNREALRVLREQISVPLGAHLLDRSIMEDKLVGDLLAVGGIFPVETGWTVSVRRRLHPGEATRARWHIGFDPSPDSPTKILHADDTDHLRSAWANKDRPGLRPSYLWAPRSPVRLGGDSNAVELISPREKLERLNAAPLAVVATMRNESTMLPRFLEHYRALGVECFLIADNVSDDGTFAALEAEPDVVLFSAESPYGGSTYGVEWQEALLAGLRPNRWSLVADADELLVSPGGLASSVIEDLEREDATAARVFMLDLYPQGPLSGADMTLNAPFDCATYCDAVPFLQESLSKGPFSNAPTWTSGVRHRLLPGSRPELFVAQKVPLLKYSRDMRLSAGLHYLSGARLSARPFLFGHFKYTAAFDEKAREEVRRREHFNGAEEYQAYLDLFSGGQGAIYCPGASVPWTDAPQVQDILNGHLPRAPEAGPFPEAQERWTPLQQMARRVGLSRRG